MSEDKEREVTEQTRRNHSDIHAVTGNIRKIKPRGGSRIYGENEVRNPIKAVAIVIGTILFSFALVYIIYLITSVFFSRA
jgi:hypothetical protein